jgi:acetylornithine deacetylase/succinyl-diaminopimelate desuccinylase-like protein
MSDYAAFIDREQSRFKDELFDFLRIPSVSTSSEHKGDIQATAQWLAERMREAGLIPEILETPGHPVVLGEWREAGPDAPTLLIYGHYDVQPAEPLNEWTTPAFEPDERDGRIYARGAVDDKGQAFMHLKALEAHLKTTGSLPVNVVMVVEGEEEIGSPNLTPFVKEHQERLACDAVVISDSDMFGPGMPSLLFSLRGLAYFELRVQGPSSDLHSGSYGGPVVNPGNALAKILTSLHNADGSVAIDGFYDDVVEWDEGTRNLIRGLPFKDEVFLEEVGSTALDGGEEGYTAPEKLWIRPTCDVHGLLCGYTGEGAKTVLPAKAMAKVSFRLVPDQDPDRVAEIFRAHIEKATPPGVTVEVEDLHGGRPWRAQLEGHFFEAAGRALERAFGVRPLICGEGGSIPIVVEFEEILKAPAVLMGFALPGCNMHAPDEWLSVENFEKGIRAIADFYDEL